MLHGKAVTDLAQPIRHRAADLLQRAILQGRFRPGQEIPQLGLARELGLSQSSVREALLELENRGLLVKKGRTWTITRLALDDLSDLYQVRAVLEPLACRLAAFSWRQEDSLALERCLDTMREAAAEKNYPKHSQADMEFHQIIWRAQPNRVLHKQLAVLCMPLFAYDLVERSGCFYLDFDRSSRQHQNIIRVLGTRDGFRAERFVRRLIERFHYQDIKDFHSLEASPNIVDQFHL
jgi:DNA-binding GntR family transcriptional regulator